MLAYQLPALTSSLRDFYAVLNNLGELLAAVGERKLARQVGQEAKQLRRLTEEVHAAATIYRRVEEDATSSNLRDLSAVERGMDTLHLIELRHRLLQTTERAAMWLESWRYQWPP
jgi:hypothetical protein